MALDQEGVQLVAAGAIQFVQQMTAADTAVNSFISSLRNAERIRTPQLAPDINQIQVALAKANIAASEFSSVAKNLGIDIGTTTKPIGETTAAVAKLVEQLQAASRVRTTDITSQALSGIRPGALTSAAQQASLASQQAQIRQNFANFLPLTSGLNAFTAITRAAPQAAQAIQQASGPANAFAAILARLGTASTRVAQASDDKTRAIRTQSDVEQQASGHGISYLSTLSAVHAGSFLLGNSTFTTAGSILTLGLAFNRAGPGAVIFGTALGTAFLAIRSLVNSFDALVTAAETAVRVLVTAGAAAGAALAAGFALSVKEASNLEDQFALIRGVTGGTDEQLASLGASVVSLSREFGINQGVVAQAASLYARAGGDINDMTDTVADATRSIIQLTIASQGELGAPAAARAVAQLKNSFSVSTQEAADFITGLAQKTTLSFSEITQALQQVGPAAANLKIPLLDVGAAIGLAANASLRGTVAGSGLKQVFLDLAAPSREAAVVLKQYNISLFDAQGAVRPLVDVFNDMNQAFGAQAVAAGRVTDAQSAYALATVFGSRAGQAAAIIAKTEASAFIELRNGIAAVTATDLANQLLVPTSKQLDIARQNVLALAGAFGGPLNAGIGLGLNAVNKFLQTIGTGPFVLAGQAIVALATGGGFGQLEQSLVGLTQNDDVIQFITDIVNVLLNARDAVVTQIVPAFIALGQGINQSLAGVNFTQFFTDLSTGIRTAAGVMATLIGALGNLAREVIENRNRGAELRQVVLGLATVFGTSLVGALALAALPMTITIKLLESVGRAVIALLDDIEEFDSIWTFAWQAAKDSVSNFTSEVFPKLQATGALIIAIAARNAEGIATAITLLQAARAVDISGTTDKALVNTAAQLEILITKINTTKTQLEALKAGPKDIFGATDFSIQKLEDSLKDFESQRAELTGVFFKLQNDAQRLQPIGATTLPTTIAGVVRDLRRIKSEAETSFDLSDIASRAEGDVLEIFSRIQSVANAAASGARAGAVFEGDSTAPGFLPNPKDIAKIADKIEEIIRDLNVKVSNINQELFSDLDRIVRDGFEKITDAEGKFVNQIDDLRSKTQDRIDDIQLDASLQRAQRGFIQEFSRDQEDEASIRSEGLQLQEQAHSNSMDRIKTRRSRDTEDASRDFGLAQQIAERSFTNQAEAADVAFRRIQRARSDSLTDSQERETNQLRSSLKAAADARQLTQDLARAKTPEERAGISARSREAGQEARFAEQQQTQLDALSKRHKREQQALGDALEDQGFTRRLSQQLVEFQRRLGFEADAVRFRRLLENRERGTREQEELNELRRRFGLTKDDVDFRRDQQGALQAENERLEDFNRQRNIEGIRREAAKQENILGRNFVEQQTRNFRELLETIGRLGEKGGKDFTGVFQNIADKQDDIIREADKLGIPVPAAFFQLELLAQEVLLVNQAFQLAVDSKNELFDISMRGGSLGIPGQLGVPGFGTPQSLFVPSLQATVASAQQGNLAMSLTPTGFFNSMTTSLVDAFRIADAQGLLNQAPNIQVNTGDANLDRRLEAVLQNAFGRRR